MSSPRVTDVTVIIPAFRAAATIDRAMASVASQTLRPRAVVVVDDGSPDNTFDRALAWQGRIDGTTITVLQQPNSGPGSARNRALAEAQTEWVAFLDADDEWLPDKLERSMAHADTGQYVLIAHDSVEVQNGEERRLDCARRFRDSPIPFVGLYRRGYIDTATVVARLEAVRTAGGFDTSLPNAQDFDLWLAMLSSPKSRFIVFDDVLSRYHRMPGSVMTHIDRRRSCCMVIARRYALHLAAHPGSPLASLWFRTLAVHHEAIRAHYANGNLAGAFRSVLALAPNLVASSVGYLAGRLRGASSRSISA